MAQSEEKIILWKDRKHFMWFPFSFTKYEVSDGRLYIQRGLLKTVYEETLLYRIVDISMEQTLAQKLFGTGDIVLCVKVDKSTEIVLKNIKHPLQVKRQLSQLVEHERTEKRVVGNEFFGNRDQMHVHFDGDGCEEAFDNDMED